MGYEKVNVSMASGIGIDRERRAERVREAEQRGMTMEMAVIGWFPIGSDWIPRRGFLPGAANLVRSLCMERF